MAGTLSAQHVATGGRPRAAFVLFVGLGPVLSGCANELGPQRLGGPVVVSAKVASVPLVEHEPLRRGAISDRVLAAIALERVTGRQAAAQRLLPQR